MAQQDYTPHQQKIIKRYYDNSETIMRQRLAELVGELYLAEGKKKQKLWASAAAAMQKLGVPVATGRFGAMMQVELVNDGPVTLILDSK